MKKYQFKQLFNSFFKVKVKEKGLISLSLVLEVTKLCYEKGQLPETNWACDKKTKYLIRS